MSHNENLFKGSIGRTYQDSRPWWPDELSAPKGAPNIVIIVLDDVGFADLGCYGSEIATPSMDRLARGGVRYSNFHVTSMCSPTRACLFTGRNAHAVGMGIIAEWSCGYPGYRGQVTARAAIIAEVLRDGGYSTYAVGKWHLTNIAHYGAAGPQDNWPLGRGFGRWYGFHGALTDQWNPELYQDNRPIHLHPRETYHLSTDLVDHAIADLRDHKTSAPHRPFLLYLAFGACHFPHHVPREFIEKYRGRYDIGWDAVRATRLERQHKLGIVPAGTGLAPLNPGVTPWRDLAPDVRRLCARRQETYAAFLEHDAHPESHGLDTCRTLSFCPNLMWSWSAGWKYLPGLAGAAPGPRATLCANSGPSALQRKASYSIASSASASSVFGRVRPSALAVLRLITSRLQFDYSL